MLRRIFIPSLLTFMLIASSHANSQASSMTYQVQAGDTLSALAKTHLGDERRWREIWSLNPQLRNPNALRAGSSLLLPTSATHNAGQLSTQTHPSREALAQQYRAAVRDEVAGGSLQRFADRRTLATDAQLAQAPRVQANLSEGQAQVMYASNVSSLYNIGERYPVYAIQESHTVTQNQAVHELLRVGEAQLMHKEADRAKFHLMSQAPNRQESTLYVLPSNPYRNLQTSAIREPHSPGNNEMRITRVFHNEPDGVYVLLNQGTNQGVGAGRLAHYYKKDFVSEEQGRLIEYPTSPAGVLLVFKTFENSSFAKVLSAQRIPAPDDRVN
ncbi:LysM peptidoglycan-binding domain-containing protein [Nitrincola nitratireducens]|uniref:LysM domain protein n=1 Tax=Nitrincola nitratireducens TaxID=1229521 RepID=W9V526_9GAMM|nr:LysM domain-containing protein [Nitrincola nitratireducens]EXJ12036.1 LysM domain protein [Nitrincola nitratireducens]